MAGKRIGDHQMGVYKTLRGKFGQHGSAAKAGISVSSARRLDRTQTLPSHVKSERSVPALIHLQLFGTARLCRCWRARRQLG